MKEDYNLGEIEIQRNFNKRGGKFFYVIRRKFDSSGKWLGKIYFVKKFRCWRIELERSGKFTEEETKFIQETLEKIEEELGK